MEHYDTSWSSAVVEIENLLSSTFEYETDPLPDIEDDDLHDRDDDDNFDFISDER